MEVSSNDTDLCFKQVMENVKGGRNSRLYL